MMSEVISTQELLDKYYPFPDTTSSPEMVEDVVLQSIYIPPECESVYDYGCSCMVYLTRDKGIPIKGDAINVVPNVDFPIVGGVVLIHLPNGVGHAAYIEAILINGNLWVSECNWRTGKCGTRVIDKDSPDIFGYWFTNPNL